ncbi:hypothetical protein C4587_01905 [Candidatus Parcubacteria bacterium]|nr:MAG: hypothetical protein C4587_01905 [Candidatus Parcubacteria bacterium]
MNPDSLYNSACDLIRNRRYDKARDLLKRAIVMNPRHLPALHDLAGCYGMANDWPNAEKLYKRVIELDPACYSALWNLGVIYFSQGKMDESLEVLQHAVHVNPNCAEAYMAAANTLGALGRIREALTCDKKAIELKPDDPVLWDAYLMRSLYSFDLTEQEKAEIHFEYGRRFGYVT